MDYRGWLWCFYVGHMRDAVGAKAVSEEIIGAYRANGFVRISGVLSEEQAAEFRRAALELSAKWRREGRVHGQDRDGYRRIFTQLVNVWREDEVLARLTLSKALAGIAEQLVGKPVRVWHDHLLIKEPHNEAATEFHQDQPYWPHAEASESLSAWVALQDVPAERGCMTFLLRSHLRTGLDAQDLADAQSLFSIDPDMRWRKRVTVPLRAGDCTFHHSRMVHMATPNLTDQPRVAHVIAYMSADTRYSGRPHPVTDPLGLAEGDQLDGEMFPRVG